MINPFRDGVDAMAVRFVHRHQTRVGQRVTQNHVERWRTHGDLAENFYVSLETQLN